MNHTRVEKEQNIFRIQILVSGPEKVGVWKISRDLDAHFIARALRGDKISIAAISDLLFDLFKKCAEQRV